MAEVHHISEAYKACLDCGMRQAKRICDDCLAARAAQIEELKRR